MVAKLFLLALTLFCAASAAPEARGSRITGGTQVPIEDAPYVAAFVYFYPRPQIYLQRCVGAIVSSWHVITTSFCFNGAILSNMSVRAGSSHSLSGGQVTTIRRLVQHPDYQATPRQNDIAVVTLDSPLPISNTVNVLYLPPQGYIIPDDTRFRIVSWGFESEGGAQHQFLQSINLNKVNQDECRSIYADIGDVLVDDPVFCAAQEGNVGTCFGDSGAPATVNNVLVGIASVYQECGTDDYPDVFTRVDRFTNWILEVAQAPSRSGVPVRVAN